MKRQIAVCLALAMACLGTAVPSRAVAQNRNRSLSGTEVAQMDYGRDTRREHDQDWSDRGWGDRVRSGEIDLEGRWITKRGYGQPPNGNSQGGRNVEAAALPRRLVIDQRRNVIRVQDFKGRLVQQIVIGGRNRDDTDQEGNVFGQWRGSKLVTIRNGDHNTRIIQTFAVANRGRTLVVYTRQNGMGTRQDVEFTNVYQRV